MKKVFLIPVYNEERNIPKLLDNLNEFSKKRNWNFSIYVVNDGSIDGTLRILESYKTSMPLHVISLDRNMGPGAAFKEGFKKILNSETKETLVITMEADGTSDLSILDSMIERAEERVDLALASCYAEGGGVKGTSLYRKVMSIAANLLIKCVSHSAKIKTYSSFYRVYRYPVLLRLHQIYGDRFIEERGFAFAIEILLKLLKLNIRIEEIPIVLDCRKRIGKSKMRVTSTVLAYLRILSKEILHGLFSRHSPKNAQE